MTSSPDKGPDAQAGATEQQVGAQLAQSLLDLVTKASAGDALEAQRIILRRMALQGDIVPSRVSAPRNVTEIGGYLNLLESLGQTDMELQTLAGILGVAGAGTPKGLVGAAPALPLTSLVNDRPTGPAQASLPLKFAVRRDFADALVAALDKVHSRGGVVPMLAGPVGLPLAGLAAAIRPDPTPYLGRTLTLAWAYALVNPVTDPLVLARPKGSSDVFQPAARVDTGGSESDFDALACTDSSCTPVALTGVRLAMLSPTLSPAGFYPAAPPTTPSSARDRAWAEYRNSTGLVVGQTRLGDELSLVHGWDAIAASVYADVLDWVWDGTRFGPPGAPSTGEGS